MLDMVVGAAVRGKIPDLEVDLGRRVVNLSARIRFEKNKAIMVASAATHFPRRPDGHRALAGQRTNQPTNRPPIHPTNQAGLRPLLQQAALVCTTLRSLCKKHGYSRVRLRIEGHTNAYKASSL